MKVVCWNTAHLPRAWDVPTRVPDRNVVLLQEGSRVPGNLKERFQVDESLWPDGGGAHRGYPSVVVSLSDRVAVIFIATRRISDARSHDFNSSEWSRLDAAIVTSVAGGGR